MAGLQNPKSCDNFIAGPTGSSLLVGPLTTERELLALLEMIFPQKQN